MKLKELTDLLLIKKVEGSTDIEITGIQMDSRKIERENLFVCVPGIEGLLEDRHKFIGDAVKNGAVAIISEKEIVEYPDITKVYVKDARNTMAIFSNHFFNYPSNHLNLFGVTGTNGKTTVTYIIDKIFSDYNINTGLMGNNGVKINDRVLPTDINTQESPSLQRNLKEMVDHDVDYCIIEASSQGLDLQRVVGCHFKTAIFTNLTQDHLDYHGSFEEYRKAKGFLFSRLGNSESEKQKRYAVLNADDPASEYFEKLTTAETVTYGIEESADVMAKEIKITPKGVSFKLESFKGNIDLIINMLGRFNVYNVLASVATALIENIPLESIKKSLAAMKNINGRMELVDAGQEFLVIVDYAHTPDALRNVLTSLNEFSKGNIITVFGCGGDRDAHKRPIMGKIASELSDYVFITSDNPRKEDLFNIMKDITKGIDEQFTNYELIADREQAIHAAIKKASSKDIILIAGKGHESIQVLADQSIYFDDREVANKAIKNKLR